METQRRGDAKAQRFKIFNLFFASLRLCVFALIFSVFPWIAFTSAQVSLQSMTLEEKVGQLFVAPLSPMRDQEHEADWLRLMNGCHVGNIILKHSDVDHQIAFLNTLQIYSKYPLLVTADAEWGLAMRMKDTIAFPKNNILGQIEDLSLIEAIGQEIGRQARLVGIHLNLAPVVDVNSNPENPVINNRSFGSDPLEVAKRGVAMINGFHSSQLLSCAKHFPGHGDTTVDSHKNLPRIDHPLERLHQIELPPFIAAIEAGVSSIMTAHILIPSLDPTLPVTLSSKILTQLLRNELHFDGLIITDALNMKALTEQYTTEEIALLAHEAGADLLLYGAHLYEDVDRLLQETIPRAYQTILNAYKEEQLPIERLDASVLRILKAKESLDLFSNRIVESNPCLVTQEALALKEKLEAAQKEKAATQ